MVEKLSPTRRLLIAAFTLAIAAVGFATGRSLLRPTNKVHQPIKFNHRIHVDDAGIECLTCHEYFETRQHSGLPSLATCLMCHEEAMTDSPEEQKLLVLAKESPGESFRKLFKMPDHVYYSHRRHVVLADIACEVCHGAIAETTEPPLTPLVNITMDTCVGCHEKSGARNDCTLCHR